MKKRDLERAIRERLEREFPNEEIVFKHKFAGMYQTWAEIGRCRRGAQGEAVPPDVLLRAGVLCPKVHRVARERRGDICGL